MKICVVRKFYLRQQRRALDIFQALVPEVGVVQLGIKAARRLDHPHGLLCSLGIAGIVDRDERAGRGQPERYAASDAASAAGVLVTRAGPGFVQSVVELALGFMVDLSRGVSRATADYHSQRKPEIIMGRQLAGSRLGIIGYGSIGRYLAQIARVMGMEVLIADPFATVGEKGLQHVPLDDLLVRSNFVVCLAVASEQTENLIGQAALARMQRHAFFINLSRGNLVDEAALMAALRENRIAGAAIDVGRARDQMPTLEMAKRPNVIATPHIGGLTPPAIESQSRETVGQVEAIIKGEVPKGAVNADRWTRR